MLWLFRNGLKIFHFCKKYIQNFFKSSHGLIGFPLANRVKISCVIYIFQKKFCKIRSSSVIQKHSVDITNADKRIFVQFWRNRKGMNFFSPRIVFWHFGWLFCKFHLQCNLSGVLGSILHLNLAKQFSFSLFSSNFYVHFVSYSHVCYVFKLESGHYVYASINLALHIHMT